MTHPAFHRGHEALSRLGRGIRDWLSDPVAMESDRRSVWVLFVLSVLGCGLGAVWFGFTLEWDLLNYHLYNAHDLLGGRSELDVAPAHLQTYLNPLVHLPLYLAFIYWSPVAVVFVTGMIQGAQVVLIYLLARRLLEPAGDIPRWIYLVLPLLGLMGPIFLNQLGSWQADTILSACVLGSLLLVLPGNRNADQAPSWPRAVVAGVLLGVAVALKLTFAIYAVALGLALALCPGPTRRLPVLLALGMGGLAGVLLAGGWWFWVLWTEFGNPVFPFFNQWFDSPWASSVSFRDQRFLPDSIAEGIFYPVLWLFDPHRVWELPFRDLRLVMLIPLSILFPLLISRRGGPVNPNLRVLCVFFVASYLLWLSIFSIYRYLGVLEMLAPLALFVMGVAWFGRHRAAVMTAVVLLVSQLEVSFERPVSTWRFVPGAVNELSALPPDSMVVMDGYEPLGYLGVWLRKVTPMVRLRANFYHGGIPSDRHYQLAVERIKAHPGAHFLLRSGSGEPAPFLATDLADAGLELTSPDDCAPVFRDEELQRIYPRPLICPLQPLGSGKRPEVIRPW